MAIETLKNAIEHHAKAVSTTENADRHPPSTIQAVKAVVSFDDKTVTDTQTENNRQYRVQNSIRWAAWCAFVAATIYAGIAAYQAYQARKGVKAATEANAITQKHFALSERPWLAANYALEGPVTFDANGVSVDYVLRIRNVGHPPAFNVNVGPAVFNSQSGEFLGKQKDLCMSGLPATAEFGATIFPGGEWVRRIEVAANAGEMDKSKTFVGFKSDELMLHTTGCVDYVDRLEGATGGHHQTFYSYSIFALSDTGSSMPIKRGINVPLNRLRFYSDEPLGNGAN
jgi:hypothetical protein